MDSSLLRNEQLSRDDSSSAYACALGHSKWLASPNSQVRYHLLRSNFCSLCVSIPAQLTFYTTAWNVGLSWFQRKISVRMYVLLHNFISAMTYQLETKKMKYCLGFFFMNLAYDTSMYVLEKGRFLGILHYTWITLVALSRSRKKSECGCIDVLNVASRYFLWTCSSWS